MSELYNPLGPIFGGSGSSRSQVNLPDSEIWSAIADELASKLEDVPYKIRYGMGAAEKHRRSLSGEVPGSTPNPGSENEARETRRASGYFAGKRWPRLAPLIQGGISDVRYALGLDDEGDLGQVGDEASQIGVSEAIRSDPETASIARSGQDLQPAMDTFEMLRVADAARPSPSDTGNRIDEDDAETPWLELMNGGR